MKKRDLIPTMVYLLLAMYCFSCKKYLEVRSDKSLVVISKLSDLQSLLDRPGDVNWNDSGSPEVVSDNYYLAGPDYESLSDNDKNIYIWNGSNIYPSAANNDWGMIYNEAYVANTVLSNIDKINRTPDDQSDWNNVNGQALFLRAKSFLSAVSIWSLAYDPKTADTDLGIPLRLDPDFNNPSVRSTVQQTYDQIIRDLQQSIQLLPITPLHVLRASKPAAYGLLARVYLFMREYAKAGLYADSCLQLRNYLMDYNGDPDVDAASSFPFAQFNGEVIYSSQIPYPSTLYYGNIDSTLYNSYPQHDLRKLRFFASNGLGPFAFTGNYENNTNLFSGIAVDEIYLMRAECYARAGKVAEAMNDLNILLLKRWETGTFVAFTAVDPNDALNKILVERRKELVFRNLRWMDIKRLNKEDANIMLVRNINGQVYSLPPNDLRYALAIPEDLVSLFGIRQNPR